MLGGIGELLGGHSRRYCVVGGGPLNGKDIEIILLLPLLYPQV